MKRPLEIPLLLILLCGALAHAQDTPITIDDGSPLKIGSSEPWVVLGPSEIRAARSGNSVFRVTLTFGKGKPVEIPFAAQRCDVSVQYGGITILLSTTADGKDLRIQNLFGAFEEDFDRSADGRLFTSKDGAQRISRVTLRRNGNTIPLGGAAVSPVRINVGYRP